MAAMREKHSSHVYILVTGGWLGRRGGFPLSGEEASSAQMSVLSSDISTNSRDKMRLTTLDGMVAVGLYGPGVWRDASCLLEMGCPTFCGLGVVAVVAKVSSSDAGPSGMNVERGGRAVGLGISPNLAALCPAVGVGDMDCNRVGPSFHAALGYVLMALSAHGGQ